MRLLTPHAPARTAEDLPTERREALCRHPGRSSSHRPAPKPRLLPRALLSCSDLSGGSGALLDGTGQRCGGFAVNLRLPSVVFFCFLWLQSVWTGCPLPLPEFTAGACYKHRALMLTFRCSFEAHFYYGTAHAKASYHKQHKGNGLHLMGGLGDELPALSPRKPAPSSHGDTNLHPDTQCPALTGMPVPTQPRG